MSGGSHNYVCFTIEQELVGNMHDRELNDLMADIAKLAHDLEWADSADIGREDYDRMVKAFKKKWFKQSWEERLRDYVDTALTDLRVELHKMIGDETNE